MSSPLLRIVRGVLLAEDIAARQVYSGSSDSTSTDVDSAGAPTDDSDLDIEDFKGAPVFGSNRAPGVYTPQQGDTAELRDFIKAFIPAYKAAFGKDVVVGSTYRSLRSQAEAMRFPLASGDFDRLYKDALGGDHEKVKDLIGNKQYEAAAKILETKPKMRRSHVLGKAVDFSFKRNGLAGGDHKKFGKLVAQVADQAGIVASLNDEQADHFHVNVTGRKPPVKAAVAQAQTPAPAGQKAAAPAAQAQAPQAATKRA